MSYGQRRQLFHLKQSWKVTQFYKLKQQSSQKCARPCPIYRFPPICRINKVFMSNRIQKEGLQDGSPEETVKCPVCRLMYGHETFNFLCSRCFRQSQEGKKLQEYSCRVRAENNPIKVDASLAKQAESTTKKQQSKPAESQEKGDRVDVSNESLKEVSQLKEKEEKQENFDFLKRPLPQQFKFQQEKCVKCFRKTKLLGYDCRHCLRHFCKDHRMPESHSCQVDFFALSQQQKKAALKSSGKKKTKIAEI